MDKIKLDAKFALFNEHWRPKTIATLNGQEIKLVKVKGEFPWHHHDNEDEFFMVWRGTFRVEFRDRVVTLEPGESVVVPRGIEHRTCACPGPGQARDRCRAAHRHHERRRARSIASRG